MSKNIATLKSRSGVNQGHSLKVVPFDTLINTINRRNVMWRAVYHE